ncbi:MAG: BMP family protein, partial [Clostridia bacterium]|nr:BMP family protein [Clostridia bacterium]
QYAETFTDSAKGKAVAIKMFDECDIVFHAAGGAGVGVIEAAKERDKYAIGVDMDQINLAPDNILTSAVKDVGRAIEIIAARVMNGENLAGQTFNFGIKEKCVGIPENNPNMSEKVSKLTKKIEEKISTGKIIPPSNLTEYNNFINNL